MQKEHPYAAEQLSLDKPRDLSGHHTGDFWQPQFDLCAMSLTPVCAGQGHHIKPHCCWHSRALSFLETLREGVSGWLRQEAVDIELFASFLQMVSLGHG